MADYEDSWSSTYNDAVPLGGKPKRPKRRGSPASTWEDVILPGLIKVGVVVVFLFLCGVGVLLATYSG